MLERFQLFASFDLIFFLYFFEIYSLLKVSTIFFTFGFYAYRQTQAYYYLYFIIKNFCIKILKPKKTILFLSIHWTKVVSFSIIQIFFWHLRQNYKKIFVLFKTLALKKAHTFHLFVRFIFVTTTTIFKKKIKNQFSLLI